MRKKSEKWMEKIEEIFIAIMQAVGVFFLFMRVSGRRIESADHVIILFLLIALTSFIFLLSKRREIWNCSNQRLEH